MIRIIVADDHDLVRAGICSLLESKSDIEVIGEAGTGRETLALCEKLKPDIVLLDLEIPDLDGFEVTRLIASTQPGVKTLILTMYDKEEYAVRLIQAGASGFIAKWTSPSELPGAIRKVASGKIYITPSVMEKLVSLKFKSEEENPVSLLSDRELQVLVRLARGSEPGEIADELCLSYSTVGTYKNRILEKLKLRNVSDLTRFAIRHELIGKF